MVCVSTGATLSRTKVRDAEDVLLARSVWATVTVLLPSPLDKVSTTENVPAEQDVLVVVGKSPEISIGKPVSQDPESVNVDCTSESAAGDAILMLGEMVSLIKLIDSVEKLLALSV